MRVTHKNVTVAMYEKAPPSVYWLIYLLKSKDAATRCQEL